MSKTTPPPPLNNSEVTLRSAVIKLAHSNPELRAHLLPILTASTERQGMEFDTKEEMDKYLKSHPGADRSKHSVSNKPSHADMVKHHEKGFADAYKKTNAEYEAHGDTPLKNKYRDEAGDHGAALQAHKLAINEPSKKNTQRAHALSSLTNKAG